MKEQCPRRIAEGNCRDDLALRVAVQPGGFDERAVRLLQVLVHRRRGGVAVARGQCGGDALEAAQHDGAHAGVVQRQRAQVLQVVGTKACLAAFMAVAGPKPPAW